MKLHVVAVHVPSLGLVSPSLARCQANVVELATKVSSHILTVVCDIMCEGEIVQCVVPQKLGARLACRCAYEVEDKASCTSCCALWQLPEGPIKYLHKVVHQPCEWHSFSSQSLRTNPLFLCTPPFLGIFSNLHTVINLYS